MTESLRLVDFGKNQLSLSDIITKLPKYLKSLNLQGNKEEVTSEDMNELEWFVFLDIYNN